MSKRRVPLLSPADGYPMKQTQLAGNLVGNPHRAGARDGSDVLWHEGEASTDYFATRFFVREARRCLDSVRLRPNYADNLLESRRVPARQ